MHKFFLLIHQEFCYTATYQVKMMDAIDMNLKSIYITEHKLKTFINDLKNKYIPSEFYYNILFDRHFINRFYDRDISVKDISKMITKIVKRKLCEVVYYEHVGVKNIYFQDGKLIVIGQLRSSTLVLKTLYEREDISHIEDVVIDVNETIQDYFDTTEHKDTELL